MKKILLLSTIILTALVPQFSLAREGCHNKCSSSEHCSDGKCHPNKSLIAYPAPSQPIPAKSNWTY